MNASTQLLQYNALAISTYNPTNKCDNYLWPTGVVFIATEVLHNTCNMCIHDLPDMYALIP